MLLGGTAAVDEPLVADRMFVDDGIDDLIEDYVNVQELEAGRRQEVCQCLCAWCAETRWRRRTWWSDGARHGNAGAGCA